MPPHLCGSRRVQTSEQLMVEPEAMIRTPSQWSTRACSRICKLKGHLLSTSKCSISNQISSTLPQKSSLPTLPMQPTVSFRPNLKVPYYNCDLVVIWKHGQSNYALANMRCYGKAVDMNHDCIRPKSGSLCNMR